MRANVEDAVKNDQKFDSVREGDHLLVLVPRSHSHTPFFDPVLILTYRSCSPLSVLVLIQYKERERGTVERGTEGGHLIFPRSRSQFFVLVLIQRKERERGTVERGPTFKFMVTT